MAVAIVLSAIDVFDQLEMSSGAVLDEQATGEILNIDLTGLNPGARTIQRLLVHSGLSPSTIPDLDPNPACIIRLLNDSGVNLEFATARIFQRYDDTDLDGAPSLWVAQFDYPFNIKLLNTAWTITASVPPADANATPIANFNVTMSSFYEREG